MIDIFLEYRPLGESIKYRAFAIDCFLGFLFFGGFSVFGLLLYLGGNVASPWCFLHGWHPLDVFYINLLTIIKQNNWGVGQGAATLSSDVPLIDLYPLAYSDAHGFTKRIPGLVNCVFGYQEFQYAFSLSLYDLWTLYKHLVNAAWFRIDTFQARGFFPTSTPSAFKIEHERAIAFHYTCFF